MLHRHIINTDFKAKFKILKESKISLVVSALLISSTLISPANAATTTISTAVTGPEGYNDGANSLEITNTGFITFDDTGYAVPVQIADLQANQTIINSGTIDSTLSTGTLGTAGAIYIQTSGTAATSAITNNGTMTATTDTGAAFAINIIGPVAGDITNSSTGTITANGVSAAGATGAAIGIKITGATSGIITNGGTINATATNGHARGIEVNGALDGSIVNDGTINVTALGDAFGILLGTTDGTGTVTNNGDIIVNGGTDGNAVRESYGFKTSKATGGVTNTGTIKATINSEYDQQGYSLYMRFNEAFTNEASGKLYGNIAAYLNTGNVINKGLVSLPYNVNGRSSSADADGVANLANFNQHATGTLEIGLLTDGTTTTHSKFIVQQNATFADGSTIGVNVLAASTDVGLLEGTTLDDVVTAGNLTLAGTLNVTDNSALLDFEYAEDANTIDLTAVAANGDDNILKSTKAGLGNSNEKAAAGALDKIKGSGNTKMTSVFTALNALSTDKAVAAAVASTTPQTATASAGVSTQIMSGMSGIVEMRQNVNVGLNSGDPLMTDRNVWVKPYFSTGEQNDKDGMNGFDVNTQGIAIGIDGEYDTNKRVGLAVFYTQAQVDVNNVSQSSDLDVFNALVYGNVPVFDERTNFLYQIGYGMQKTKSSRDVFTGDVAKAEYTSKTASLDLKLTRSFKAKDNLTLTPVVNLTYRRSDTPSNTETGAGVLNLHTNSFSSTEVIGEIGTQAAYTLDNDSKILANAHIGYDFKDEQTTVTSSYAGAVGTTFDTQGIDNGRVNYSASVGYEISNVLGGDINFMYNYQAKGSDFSNNTFSSKYVLKF
jgi:uncharacterized protein with beta-barrel porin domain